MFSFRTCKPRTHPPIQDINGLQDEDGSSIIVSRKGSTEITFAVVFYDPQWRLLFLPHHWKIQFNLFNLTHTCLVVWGTEVFVCFLPYTYTYVLKWKIVSEDSSLI